MIWLNGYSLPQRNAFGELHMTDIQMNSIVYTRLKAVQIYEILQFLEIFCIPFLCVFLSEGQEVRHQHPDRIASNANTGAQPHCAGGG